MILILPLLVLHTLAIHVISSLYKVLPTRAGEHFSTAYGPRYTLLQKPPSQHLSPAKLQLLSTPVLSQSLLPRIRTYPSVWSVYSHADT